MHHLLRIFFAVFSSFCFSFFNKIYPKLDEGYLITHLRAGYVLETCGSWHIESRSDKQIGSGTARVEQTGSFFPLVLEEGLTPVYLIKLNLTLITFILFYFIIVKFSTKMCINIYLYSSNYCIISLQRFFFVKYKILRNTIQIHWKVIKYYGVYFVKLFFLQYSTIYFFI